jgi:signal transduction histidine kinase
MEQVIYHLISNSIKFSHWNAAPVINISSKLLTLPETKQKELSLNSSEYFEIRFQDNGIGIESSHLNRIFDLFSKLDHNQELKGGGTGLAYCRKIIRNHGGLITVESEPDKGTDFIVYLPANRLSRNLL